MLLQVGESLGERGFSQACWSCFMLFNDTDLKLQLQLCHLFIKVEVKEDHRSGNTCNNKHEKKSLRCLCACFISPNVSVWTRMIETGVL